MRAMRSALALLTVLALAAPAAAKVERTVAYRMQQVWPTAIRFLRVDEGLEIVDKDAEAGYVVFVVVEKGKQYQGSLELIAATDGDRPVVRLVLKIGGRPEYTEAGLLDRMLDKLAREYGDTPEEPRPAPAPKPAPAKPAAPKK